MMGRLIMFEEMNMISQDGSLETWNVVISDDGAIKIFFKQSSRQVRFHFQLTARSIAISNNFNGRRAGLMMIIVDEWCYWIISSWQGVTNLIELFMSIVPADSNFQQHTSTFAVQEKHHTYHTVTNDTLHVQVPSCRYLSRRMHVQISTTTFLPLLYEVVFAIIKWRNKILH